jgi:uncharacterized membrane protein
MNIYLLVLRLLHIFAGIFWGGGALVMSVFVAPTVESTGASGQQFVQHIMNKLRLHIFMTIAGFTTVIGGALLYWHDSNGFTSAWMKSGAGIGFTTGAIFGLIAFMSGAITGSGNAKLAQVGGQIQGKPTEDQLSQIQTIQRRIKIVSPIHVYSMILAMIFMATARYFLF